MDSMDNNEVSQQSQSQALMRTTHEEALREPATVDAFPEEIPHLRDYWQVVFKRRWVVLTSLVIVFSTTAIGTLKQKPVYQGRAVIEISPEPANILNLKEMLQLGDTENAETYRATQIKVLQGHRLAESVVRDLQLYRVPEFYRTRSLFGLVETDPKLTSSMEGGLPDPSSDVYRNSVARYLDSVEVRPILHTSLVELLCYSHDPSLAARLANQLTSNYINQSLQSKWDASVTASEWLQGQLVGIKAKLEKSDAALQAYAQANSIVFLGERETLVNVRLQELQAEYTRAQADRLEREAIYRLYQDGKEDELPGVLSDKIVQDDETRLAELRREYAGLATTVKPDYPKAVQIQRQIDVVEAHLARQTKRAAQSIVNAYRASVAREEALGEALDEQKKLVNAVAEKSIQYNILKRDVDTNRQLYEGLLQRLKESQVSSALKSSNIDIVESAEVPRGPVRPRARA